MTDRIYIFTLQHKQDMMVKSMHPWVACCQEYIRKWIEICMSWITHVIIHSTWCSIYQYFKGLNGINVNQIQFKYNQLIVSTLPIYSWPEHKYNPFNNCSCFLYLEISSICLTTWNTLQQQADRSRCYNVQVEQCLHLYECYLQFNELHFLQKGHIYIYI